MSKTNFPIVVTIAGSDSGGGAGIQADLKSFSANRAFGASVITALTAQNTLGVTAIHDVPVDFIREQMDAVFSDLDVKAVKVGMLSQAEIIREVAKGLKRHGVKTIVVDPVMVATSGDPLLAKDAVETLKTELIPLATLITPNSHEAAILLERDLARSEEDMKAEADELLKLGSQYVLVKGGHFENAESADLLKGEGLAHWFRAPRVNTTNTHGTGCSLSSAIAANLGHGMDMAEAVGNAKAWLTRAIETADQLDVGQGSGPVHHFHNYWNLQQD